VSVDLQRARLLFSEDDLGWIVGRLRTRLERGQALDGRLRLGDPTARQREALLRLLGRRPGGAAGSISIDTAELGDVLARAGIAPDLRALVEALGGPVADRRAAYAAERARWDAVHQRLRAEAVALDVRLERWAEEVAVTGLLRRLARDAEGATRLALQATAVLGRLPARGEPLAQLAAATVGDSHALDDGAPLATLVLRAVESLTGLPRRDRSAAEMRALWARVGVLLDELSAPALVLGLRPAGDGVLASAMRAFADAGEPARVTLRQLVRHPPDWSALAGRMVFVCENPAIVAAAADRLGAACPPLVCTDGQPSGAVQALLRALADAGASLRFHADFDGGGIRIGNLLVERFGARPWRMGAADYEAAARGGGLPPGSMAERALWDPELAPAMARYGVAVHEERVVEGLLGDLRHGKADSALGSGATEGGAIG
jgi:uncharacterized protein (TIGR02679 family)